MGSKGYIKPFSKTPEVKDDKKKKATKKSKK